LDQRATFLFHLFCFVAAHYNGQEISYVHLIS
jgi:hypothetical protein